jgi:hypothetical protein
MGFDSDEDTGSPAETKEKAKVPNGAATATYMITSPAETPEPMSVTQLAIGLAAVGVVHRRLQK